MTSNAEWIPVDPERPADAVQQAIDKVNASPGEITLDFSSVRRIDSSAAARMEELAAVGGSQSSKVVLHAVNGDIYKVLKLLKLTDRFTFVN